jgi:hypothetical protein
LFCADASFFSPDCGRYSVNRKYGFFASTTPIFTAHSSLFPNWISSVKPSPGEAGPFDNRLCVTINKFWLWEPGDYEQYTQRSFRSRLQITVDGQTILIEGIDFIENETTITDSKNTVLGTVSGQAFTCVVTDLGIGVHRANISFVSTAGTSYIYDWSVVVQR